MMSSMLYLLSLCVVTVIQPTSSQTTWDIERQPENDVSSCGSNDQALNQLITMNARLMNAVSQLQRDAAESKAGNSQLRSSMSQMQKDVAELKAESPQKDVTGKSVGPKCQAT